VVVTLAGWVLTLKSIVHLLVPRALARVMPDEPGMQRALRIGGGAAIALGALLAYDSFCPHEGSTGAALARG
jgi:uncharacterized protein YjeT (DUF2065 family)